MGNDFYVLQPGSSVATSLSEGEAKQKCVDFFIGVITTTKYIFFSPLLLGTPSLSRSPVKSSRLTSTLSSLFGRSSCKVKEKKKKKKKKIVLN